MRAQIPLHSTCHLLAEIKQLYAQGGDQNKGVASDIQGEGQLCRIVLGHMTMIQLRWFDHQRLQ